MSLPTTVAPEIVDALGAIPTEEQWTAIAWPLEPNVLVAGAGSGKTSVMAARVVYLALAALGRIDAPGVMPGNVLCLTFTNKATENLRVRVRRALSALAMPEGEEPEIANYHGFAAGLLDRYGVLAGYEPGARVLSQAQREELCGRVLDTMTDSLRIPLMLRDADGLSYDEIAGQLGIGLSAVKMRIKRGREEFRRQYAAATGPTRGGGQEGP